MENTIGKNAKLLIASDLIYRLTGVFIDTFLVAYLFEITKQNLTLISLYYITIYFLRVVVTPSISKIVKKHPSTNKELLSLGIIIRAIFILFIALLSHKIVSNFIIVAIIYAISEIFYWCPHELIFIDVTTNNNRKKYVSIKEILSKIISIVSPIILGTSIELYSFSKIAIWIFVLSFIQTIITLCIKPHKIHKTTSSYEKYNYKLFLKHIKDNNLNKLKNYNLAGMAYGIIESSINTLIVVITVMTFKTSFNLGVLTTIFSFCSILSLLLYNKFYTTKNSKKVLVLCSTIIVLGVLGLLLDINKFSLIVYNFCYMITFSIFAVLYNTRKGNLVKECTIQNFKEEYIIFTNFSILIGRITGYLLMLVVSLTSNIIFLKILLAIVTIFAPTYCYFIYKSEKD